jgi:hypothetical protein
MPTAATAATEADVFAELLDHLKLDRIDVAPAHLPVPPPQRSSACVTGRGPGIR